jgi:hypothetical protein
MSRLTDQIEELERDNAELQAWVLRLEARIYPVVEWFCLSAGGDTRMFGSMKPARVRRLREMACEAAMMDGHAGLVEGAADWYGVSRRTIERDIQFLREIGIVPAKTKGAE